MVIDLNTPTIETPFPKREYVCDGCGTGYFLTARQADSTNKSDWCPCGKFFGWMLFGGLAHLAFLAGYHPRQRFVQQVINLYVNNQIREMGEE